MPPGSGFGGASYAGLISSMRRGARTGRSFPFAVEVDRQLVGVVTVSGVTWGSARWGSIGYWITSEYAGRGITPLAVALVCDHLLDTLRLHRIEISVRPENAASLRVVQKLGFTEYGRAPGYLHIAGRWAEHRLFQILAEDVPGGLVRRLDATAG